MPISRLCLATAALLSCAASPPHSDEALYRARFKALMANGGVMTDYAPLENVPGARARRPLPVRATAERTIDAQALDQAGAYAAANHSRALLVWRDGALERADYFAGATSGTPLLSRSLSKPLSAIAIGRAIALGKIGSLDQPVADFIPEWKGTAKAGIRVRHLLDMRSGLLEQVYSDDPDHPVNRAYIDPDHGWHLIHDYPLVHEPGTRFGYSNAASDLVAIVIERATRRRYAEFIGHEILGPIGAAGGSIWIDRPGGLAHSGCCMTLPAESWLRLAVLLVRDGVANGRRLLPPGFVSEMTRGTPENPYFGLGVWVAGPYTARRGFAGVDAPGAKVLHGAPYLDRGLFLFDGNASQTVYMSRAARLVILRMGDAPPKSPEWDNSLLPNLLIKGIKWRDGESRPVPQE